MADQSDPDFSEDPRGGQDVGQGYPETQEGTGDDAIDKGEYPSSSEHGGTQTKGPRSSSPEDEGPGDASGNPRAAG